jgi:hypothetical protein
MFIFTFRTLQDCLASGVDELVVQQQLRTSLMLRTPFGYAQR